MRGGLAAMMALSAGGIASPDSGGGSTSAVPAETHSSTTVSPEATVSSGG